MDHESRLLLSISNVSVMQIRDGEQTALGNGTLNVTLLSQRLRIPSASETDLPTTKEPISLNPGLQDQVCHYDTDASPPKKDSQNAETDVYLYLSMKENDFELPLPAYTKVIPQGKSAYLIPAEHIPYAFIQLDLASSSPESLETFEILLSQFTAYEERPHELTRKDLVLVDSEDGRILGSVPHTDLIVQEDPALSQPGHEKDPVVIDITTNPETQKNTIKVSPTTDADDKSASYLLSFADKISSGILISSSAISKKIDSTASRYVERHPTSELPLTFQPSTVERVRKIHHLSNSAMAMSAKATGFLASAAHSLGSGVRQKLGREDKPGKKPGLLNKSLIAFATIADSVDASTKQLLNSTSNAATTVVRHKYGDQAADISHSFGSTVRNVALVYVDARGVTRKALLKNAAKGVLLKAKVGHGDEVILGGGHLSQSDLTQSTDANTVSGPSIQSTGSRAENTASYSNLYHPGVPGFTGDKK